MRDLLKLSGIFSPEDLQAMQAELDRGNREGETPAQRARRALSIIQRYSAGYGPEVDALSIFAERHHDDKADIVQQADRPRP